MSVAGETVVAGRYRLLDRIGSGSFGAVWRARDETLRIEVALKQLKPDPTAADAERQKAVARTRREASNAARLRDHPNIVAVHDVVTEAGEPWLVMRLVRGRSLADELAARGTLHADEVAKVAAGVLAALGFAHAEGVLHRDVKPANIMLAADGTVLLTDFGIAKHHADSTQTTHGMVVGTLPYMAPERLDGTDLPAGDLFALGATMYECLAGKSPFERDSVSATVAAVLRDDPPPPPGAGPLGPLIKALLEKDHSQRPDVAAAKALLVGRGQEETRSTSAPPATSPPPAPDPQPSATPHVPPTPTPAPAPAPAVVNRWLSVRDESRLGQPLQVRIDGINAGLVQPGGRQTFGILDSASTVQVGTFDNLSVSNIAMIARLSNFHPDYVVQRSASGRLLLNIAAANGVTWQASSVGAVQRTSSSTPSSTTPSSTARRPAASGQATASGGIGVLVVVAAIVVGLLWANDASFADTMTKAWHSHLEDSHVGDCVHQLPADSTHAANWVGVPCWTAAADYKVIAVYSGGGPRSQYVCPSPQTTVDTNDLIFCVAPKN